MRFVIQRALEASVSVDGSMIGRISRGFLVLAGISRTDTKDTADKMIKKMLGLRIFEDSEGKTNLSLDAVQGELLIVSQFTLYADCRKGNRPSFLAAGLPEDAEQMYEYIIEKCRSCGYHTETGSFGADMKIQLVNDGPFTIILDSDEMWPQSV